MKNLKNMNINEMTDFFLGIGEKKYHGKQVFKWIYRGITQIDDMTDISKNLRKKLKEIAYIGSYSVELIQESKKDGTKKFLFKLPDGNMIESVFMKYKYGNTLCVSSQVGCRMGCKFCASTLNGLDRNLTAGEMADQIICAERETGEKVGHIVVMGTGEPFDNYDNLIKFIKMINDENGLNIGMRNITVSTCGIVPKIIQFANDVPQANLAISLHGVENEKRSEIMPINKTYNIDKLLDSCREYIKLTNRRLTFEYTLVRGKNDLESDMEKLAEKLKGMLCHVNLIPLNEVSEIGYKASDRAYGEKMVKFLREKGIETTLRRELGKDIDGACGQLRLFQK